MPRVSTGGPFPAIRPDETDFFTFDFTRKIGSSGSIQTAVWTCIVAPDAPLAINDDLPQNRIISEQPLAPVPPSQQILKTTALCGGFYDQLIYTLSVTVTINDGRVLALSGNVKGTYGTSPADEFLTVEKFRSDYPAFADATRFPDDEVQYWINIAVAPPNSTPAINKYRWGQFFGLGIELFVAHNLAVEDMMVSRAGPPGSGVGGGAPLVGSGVPASKSVNGVSLSYDNQIGMERDAGWWGQTPWGNQFLYYLRLAGSAPIQL